jgi:menaquinone-dependent protoporphyrinogen IX oxidase
MRSSSGPQSTWASTTVTSGTSFARTWPCSSGSSAFFSVSLAAHGDTAEAENYVEEFEQDTGWRPTVVALFGGALLYTEYGFLNGT